MNISNKQLEFVNKLEEEKSIIDEIIFSFNKWSIYEFTKHNGNYEGSEFTLEAETSWKWARLVFYSEGLDNNLLDVLKELPLGEIGSEDLPKMFSCEDMSDGETEIISNDFIPQLAEDKKRGLDLNELYYDSEIDECEYYFNKGSIYEIEVNLSNGKAFKYEEGL